MKCSLSLPDNTQPRQVAGKTMKKYPDSRAMLKRYEQEYGDAEQFPATPTIRPVTNQGKRVIRFATTIPGTGRERLRDPETGRMMPQCGDIVALRDDNGGAIIVAKWKGEWHPVPSMDEIGVYSMNSSVPTPDGSIVEPDGEGSWLRLLSLI